MAVDTNTRPPHTMGLEIATPAIGVFHNTFSPVSTFHVIGGDEPSATPDAAGPRNIGQFWAETVTAAAAIHAAISIRFAISHRAVSHPVIYFASTCVNGGPPLALNDT